MLPESPGHKPTFYVSIVAFLSQGDYQQIIDTQGLVGIVGGRVCGGDGFWGTFGPGVPAL